MLYDKYRPRTFEEIVGRNEIIEKIKNYIASKDGIPHLLFYGTPGTGKTTMATVIGKTIFKENFDECFFEFNASDDRGIEFVRTRILDICKKQNLLSDYVIILLDEADQMTDDAQFLFRRIMETYIKNVRFIFTVNRVYKIMSPLLSRFINFEFPKLDLKTVANYVKRIAYKENIKREDSYYIAIAKKANGDLRQALSLLEGNIQVTVLDKVWDQMTIQKLKAMSRDERIQLAFNGEPDQILEKIWEMIKRDKAWNLLFALCDCQSKMNFATIKTSFIANFLDKIGEY